MINVVIADDEFNTRNGLAASLKRSLPEINVVALCKNGLEVLEVLKKEQIDLVISDVKMPELNGIQLSKMIYELYPNVKIILVSAYAEFEYAQEAMLYGVRNYILKPMSYEKLRQIQNYIKELSGETENKDSFKSLVHDTSFRGLVKNALSSKDKKEIQAVLEIADDKKIRPNDFYMYIISIIDEFLQEKNLMHLLHKRELQLIENENNPQSYKSFILKIYDGLQLNLSKKEMKFNENEGETVKHIKSYVEKNLSSVTLSTSEIARLLKMSESHLCRTFKYSEKITLIEYITNRRIEKAKEYLKQPGLSAKDVGLKCGYENIRYFYSVFKKQVGVSPTQYRQQKCGEEM